MSTPRSWRSIWRRRSTNSPRSIPAICCSRELDARAKSYPGLFEDAEIDLVGTAVRNDDGGSGVAVSANGTAGGSKFALTISGNGAPRR